MSTTTWHFQRNLAALMADRGVRSDRELGERMGRGRSAVQRYTSGKAIPDLDWVEAFATALDVPVAVLLMDPGDFYTWLADHSSGAAGRDSAR